MSKQLVPKLRFPGFSGEWNLNSLEKAKLKIIDGDRGGNYPNGNDFLDDGYCLFLNAKNVTSSGFSFTEKSFITKEKDEQLRKGKLKKHDIVLTTRGTVGNVAFYDDNVSFDHLRINSGMVLIRNENVNISPNYIYILLASHVVQKQILGIAFGSAQPQLTVKEINKFTFLFPSLAEQEKIASFLTVVDNKIQQLTKKKQLLEQYKKGIMQQIFSQKIRFKDDNGDDYPAWRIRKLEDIGEFIGGGTPDTTKLEYWGGEIQWFTPTELKSKYVTKSNRTITTLGYSNSSAKMLPIGALLLSSRATIGDVSITKSVCCTNQGFQSIVVNHENNNEFIYYWLFQHKYALIEKSSGSTFPEISKTEILKIQIVAPIIGEQIKIANFFTLIDNTIDNVNALLEETQIFKKFLLQQMFV